MIGLLGTRTRKAWEILEPYIIQEREATGNPDFLVFYEDLVRRIHDRGSAVDEYRSKLKRLAS
jgi:hypothetical protein